MQLVLVVGFFGGVAAQVSRGSDYLPRVFVGQHFLRSDRVYFSG